MNRIAVLGSTGSSGRSSVSVVESYPDRFKVVSLAAGKNVEAALEQAKRWRPRVVSLSSERDADHLRNQLKAAGLRHLDVMHVPSGTVSVATHPDADFVVSAIVGFAGLEATYEAVRAGQPVRLDNYECLVAAGAVIS